MSHGRRREGAGRPQGSTNKRSRDLLKAAEASGLLPHDIPTFAERPEAARIAAPYYAPRLATTTLSGPGGRPLDFVTHAQRDAAMAASRRADD